MNEDGNAIETIAALIVKHVRLEWRGHDNADINPRSVTNAAIAILARFSAPWGDGDGTRAADDGWLPIETAPKDGKWFEAWFDKRTPEDDADFAVAGVDTLRWSGNGFWWSRHVGCSYPEMRPSGWRPLPSPPAQSGQGGV